MNKKKERKKEKERKERGRKKEKERKKERKKGRKRKRGRKQHTYLLVAYELLTKIHRPIGLPLHTEQV